MSGKALAAGPSMVARAVQATDRRLAPCRSRIHTSLSESDRWMLEHASMLIIPYQVVVIGSSVVLSILLFALPYRLCRLETSVYGSKDVKTPN